MPRGSNYLPGIEPRFGWNWLSLGGQGRSIHIDRRPKLPAQPVPAPRPMPKPVRAVLASNQAMERKLAEHAFKPWWMR